MKTMNGRNELVITPATNRGEGAPVAVKAVETVELVQVPVAKRWLPAERGASSMESLTSRIHAAS